MSRRKKCRHIWQCHWCGERRPIDPPVPGVQQHWHDDSAPVPLPTSLPTSDEVMRIVVERLKQRVGRLEARQRQHEALPVLIPVTVETAGSVQHLDEHSHVENDPDYGSSPAGLFS